MIERLTSALSDRYTIGRELGAGGMATVYLAHDVKHDRKVALKVLKPELAAVVGADRFLAEIRTTANLQHPHILPLFDSGEAEGFLYFVMPYVEGESLRERLDREKQLPVDEAIRIATEVADALEHAHAKGVIHRDIKPANILLRDGRVQVADFGIALAVQQAGGARLTETGLSVGTPHYMSPEQASGDRQLDGRSDIYSLGCVLYEMLAGEPPHTGPTAQSILSKILTEEPGPLVELRRAVPVHVAAVVRAALEKLPADRIQSASMYAAALKGEPASVRDVLQRARGDARTAASSHIAVSARRHLLLRAGYFALAALALVTISAVAVMQMRPASENGLDGTAPFTFAFTLEGSEQIAVDMDQLLFDVSNDGETIAWIGADRGPERQVFYRSLRELTVRPVPGTRGVQNVWLQLSPDGQHVSFMRNNELLAVPLDGDGTAQRIFNRRLWSWAWADDGSFVLGEPFQGLKRLAAAGAEPEILTQLEAEEVTHQFPHPLPDGRSVLLSVGQGNYYATRIEVVTRQADSLHRKVVLDSAVSAKYVRSGHLVFGRADQILAVPFDLDRLAVTGPPTALISDVQTDASGTVTEFDVSPDGTIVYVPRQGLRDYRLGWIGPGDNIDWLAVPGSAFLFPSLSPDGSTIAVTTRLDGDRWPQIYVVDLGRLVPRALTSGSVHQRAVWSPDSDELLFNSTRDGHFNLYRVSSRGGEPTRVTTSSLDHHPIAWLRDDRVVYGERLPFDRARMLRASIGAQQTADTLVSAAEGDGSDGSFDGDPSPDGRWLAFEKGAQIFIRDISVAGTGLEEQVSREGGQAPKWRRDGGALLYASLDSRRILSVAVDTDAGLRLGPETELFAAPAGIELQLITGFDVAPDGRLLVVARTIQTAPMQVIVSMNATRSVPPGR